MTRITPFSSPFLLGFELLEEKLERVGGSAARLGSKGQDGYPPYNIERIRTPDSDDDENGALILRITLAVAGFGDDDLEITVEDNQLQIKGCQNDETERDYLHRGIAARQFQRSFVLADGMRITGASLKNGLLMIDLDRPKPTGMARKIAITNLD